MEVLSFHCYSNIRTYAFRCTHLLVVPAPPIDPGFIEPVS